MRSVLLYVCLFASLPLGAQAVSKFHGTLRRIDERSMVVEADDARVVEFRLARTKFYKDSAEIQAGELKAGDRLSVEARQDPEGHLYAVNVYLEKSEPSAKTEPVSQPEDDPDRPRLRRGAPAPRPHDDTTEGETAPPAADPLIEKAREAAAQYSGKLPNYVCREFMARYESTTRPVDWKALDVVSADVVYEGAKESYRNLEVNGRATKKTIEQIGGSWSTGEFGSMLLDLFSPATAARFEPARESSASGVPARVYRFQVEQPHSHWHVQAPAQSINPAYKGSVWIDANGRVLRIEMQARQIPDGFPLDTVESAVDYARVRIGSGEFLLPVHAESLSCERGSSNCSRNAIDFRNYHKYNADSSVTFEP